MIEKQRKKDKNRTEKKKNYLSRKWRQKSEIELYLGALLPPPMNIKSGFVFLYQYIEKWWCISLLCKNDEIPMLFRIFFLRLLNIWALVKTEKFVAQDFGNSS